MTPTTPAEPRSPITPTTPATTPANRPKSSASTPPWPRAETCCGSSTSASPAPAPPPPPRRLHLIYRFHITPDVRATLAERELEELPDGSHEVGAIEWVDHRRTADLPIFPPVGPALAALHDPRATVGDAAPATVTDDNHTWV